jgi:hypothetical protein
LLVVFVFSRTLFGWRLGVLGLFFPVFFIVVLVRLFITLARFIAFVL